MIALDQDPLSRRSCSQSVLAKAMIINPAMTVITLATKANKRPGISKNCKNTHWAPTNCSTIAVIPVSTSTKPKIVQRPLFLL